LQTSQFPDCSRPKECLDTFRYQMFARKLIHLLQVRLGIAFALNSMEQFQFMHSPYEKHFEMVTKSENSNFP
jgi:hypothetical protein